MTNTVAIQIRTWQQRRRPMFSFASASAASVDIMKTTCCSHDSLLQRLDELSQLHIFYSSTSEKVLSGYAFVLVVSKQTIVGQRDQKAPLLAELCPSGSIVWQERLSRGREQVTRQKTQRLHTMIFPAQSNVNTSLMPCWRRFAYIHPNTQICGRVCRADSDL